MGGKRLPKLADELYPMFRTAWEGDDSQLIAVGWKGGVSQEWRDFLEGRHKKLHPEQPMERHAELSCRYLAILLARLKLNLRGDDPEWQVGGRHLEISFAPPMPHAPKVSTRVYYRTMPVEQTKLHVPYWRAKGFFRLDEEAQLRGGLVPARCTSDMSFTPGRLTFSDGDDSVTVVADVLQ
jgi:hypothetical protein